MERLSNGVPGKWVICSRCQGHGQHVNPAIDGNGISAEQWAEWDDDEREGYFAGRYDVSCDECSGSGKVLIPDVAACSFAQKRELAEARRAKRWEAESRWEQEREMRMLGEWN